MSFSRALGIAAWLPVGVLVQTHVVSAHQIIGPSMQPTLQAAPERTWSNDVVAFTKFSLPLRGDVVMCANPFVPGSRLVKRIIGLPGDWVQFPDGDAGARRVFVKPGHVWLEGDNASDSQDSRSFGAVPMGLIHGRASCVIWPPNRLQWVNRKNLQDRLFLPWATNN